MPASRYRTVVVSDFQDRAGRWVQLCSHRDLRVVSWSGDKYASMRRRCHLTPAGAKLMPTYVDCVMGFVGFQDFADWHRQQNGYGRPELHLDKDILVKGSKVYSRETCCLVPRQVNQLFATNGARRGEYPLGVSWNTRRGVFVSQVTIDGKRKSLGQFATVEATFAAYKLAKEAQIKAVAERYRSDIDPRVFAALMAYQVEITD